MVFESFAHRVERPEMAVALGFADCGEVTTILLAAFLANAGVRAENVLVLPREVLACLRVSTDKVHDRREPLSVFGLVGQRVSLIRGPRFPLPELSYCEKTFVDNNTTYCLDQGRLFFSKC